MNAKVPGTKIVIYGSAKDINIAKTAINTDIELFTSPLTEREIRADLQAVIDKYNLKAAVLYDGNTVWPLERLVKAFKRCVKAGGPAKYFTKELYEFFHLCCGTIAHYNIHGWCEVYPDNEALKKLFLKNEYGEPVTRYAPVWKADARMIIHAMDSILKGA